MHRLILAVALVVACTTPPTEPTPAPSIASAVTACAPPVRALQPTQATLTLSPHQIGTQVVFGLDGAYVGSSYGYPLGAGRHWFELDVTGAVVRSLETPYWARPVQSPDGAQFVYTSLDPAVPNGYITYVRDTAGGTPRILSVGDVAVDGWFDSQRVLVEHRSEPPNTFHVIDARTLVESVVLRPPPSLSAPTQGEYDVVFPSGDFRWAIVNRYRSDDSIVRSDLFDVARGSYVSRTVPLGPTWLSPRGDVMVWIEGTDLRAMHLCDGRAVTLATIPPVTRIYGGMRWSADGRWMSFSYGYAYEDTPPERDIVIDFQRGLIADLVTPWGFIRQWSPFDETVVLSRYGYHDSVDRLARLTLP